MSETGIINFREYMPDSVSNFLHAFAMGELDGIGLVKYVYNLSKKERAELRQYLFQEAR